MQSALKSEHGLLEHRSPRLFARNRSGSNMSRILTGCLIVGKFVCSTNASTGCEKPTQEDTSPLELRYVKPATDWEHEVLPLGNGWLGKMVFGGIDEERGDCDSFRRFLIAVGSNVSKLENRNSDESQHCFGTYVIP